MLFDALQRIGHNQYGICRGRSHGHDGACQGRDGNIRLGQNRAQAMPAKAPGRAVMMMKGISHD